MRCSIASLYHHGKLKKHIMLLNKYQHCKNYCKQKYLTLSLKRRAFLIAGILFLILLLGFLIAPAKLKQYIIPKPPLLGAISFSQAVYDKNHGLLRLTLSRDEKYRFYTPLSQITPQAIDTLLLQEDQYFYWHPGVNPIALIKATWKTYITHGRRVGASTITMQVARLAFHINSKTWHGKLWQIIRALQLELYYSKKQILEAYLNLAPYGDNIEGIGAASLVYFAKPANKLNLPEVLTLTVMPQNPTRHVLIRGNNANANKTSDTKIIAARRTLWQRWLTQHPADHKLEALLELPLPTKSPSNLPFLAPHLVNNVLQAEPYRPTITTTLDLPLQKTLERIVHDYLERQKRFGVNNAVMMVIDSRDMSVKALIGAADFFRRDISGQVDGTKMKRSPGSALKPFVYGLALDQGIIHPATILKDVPTSFGAYNPENFDRDFVGPVSAQHALTLSRNIPAAYLAKHLHNPTLYQLLQNAAISEMRTESFYGLGLVLGGIEVSMQELIGLYAMLANGGVWRPLRMRQDEPPASTHDQEKKLLSAEASFLVLDMLKETHRPPGFEWVGNSNKTFIAWKTGTSSGYRDAWTIGIVGNYVLAVWLGDFAGKANLELVGKNMAAPLFFALANVLTATAGQQPNFMLRPNTALNLTKVAVCTASGMLPTRYCPETTLTWFIPGTSPIKQDNIYREIAIDRQSGLRTCHFDQNTDFVVYEFWSSDLLRLWQKAGIKRRVPPPFIDGCDLAKMNTNYDKGIAPQITSPQAGMQYAVQFDEGFGFGGESSGIGNSNGGGSSNSNNSSKSNSSDDSDANKKNKIPLIATVDADVKTLYWFIDKNYIGSSAALHPLWWPARTGKFIVRVIDDHGRTAAENMEVVSAHR
jgi:penicillin-binding protein 1C